MGERENYLVLEVQSPESIGRVALYCKKKKKNHHSAVSTRFGKQKNPLWTWSVLEASDYVFQTFKSLDATHCELDGYRLLPFKLKWAITGLEKCLCKTRSIFQDLGHIFSYKCPSTKLETPLLWAEEAFCWNTLEPNPMYFSYFNHGDSLLHNLYIKLRLQYTQI